MICIYSNRQKHLKQTIYDALFVFVSVYSCILYCSRTNSHNCSALVQRQGLEETYRTLLVPQDTFEFSSQNIVVLQLQYSIQ